MSFKSLTFAFPFFLRKKKNESFIFTTSAKKLAKLAWPKRKLKIKDI